MLSRLDGQRAAAAGIGHHRHASRASARRRAQPLAEMLRRNFLPLPVHARSLAVIDLHAIHADVPPPGCRISCDHARQSNELAAIARPRFQDWKIQHAEVFPQDDFLAGRILGAHFARKKFAELGQLRQHLHLAEKAFRRAQVQNLADTPGDFVQRLHAQRHGHAPPAAELVHQHARAFVPAHIFKQQRRPAGLHRAVGNLRHLQHGIHFDRHALQLAGPVQRLDPLPQIVVCHASSVQA